MLFSLELSKLVFMNPWENNIGTAEVLWANEKLIII